MSEEATLRALIVDDDALVRRATARALSHEGFACEVASDGMQAMERIRERQFHVVIADLCMPEMNGHRLVVQMLAMDVPPAIVVLTGLPEPKIVRDLMARGVDDVVEKPANYEILALRTRHIAQRRRAEQLAETRASLASDMTTSAVGENAVSRKESPCEKERVTKQVVEVRQALAAPPATYDAFQLASANAFGMDDLAAAIQAMPHAAKEVLSLANSVVFRASEERRRMESLLPEHPTTASGNQGYVIAAITFSIGLIMGIGACLLRGH